jgi:heme exporter protein B
MKNFLKQALTITAKDLRVELRTRELFSSMFVFALIVSILFNYTLDLKETQVIDVAAGLLWMIFVFAGVLGLNRMFVSEQEGGTLQGLLVSPIDRSALFCGKWLSTVIFMLITQAIVVPFFALFANLPFDRLLWLAPIFFLGTLGFAAVGIIFAAIASNTRMREVMLPVLLLPLTLPMLLGAITLTSNVLAGKSIGAQPQWLSLMIAYDVIFITVGWLAFEIITQEE